MSPYLMGKAMKILVIGISVRAMAESAVKSGYRVIALDAFGDRDLKELTESYALHRDFQAGYSPGNLYKVSREIGFDSFAYTSNLENYPEILARFGTHNRIIGNSPHVVTSVRNWVELFEKLKRAGFSVPETVLSSENLRVDAECRWMLKPMLGGGGHGISFYDPGRQSPFGDENGSYAPGYMLQEYIPGKTCSVSFVANGKDCTVLGVTEQLIGMSSFGSRGFRYNGNLLPVPDVFDPHSGKRILDKVRRLAEFLTREYGLVGVNGIDIILNGDQVYLTEVNPRYSASMELIELAYGLPMFHLHANAALEDELPEFRLESVVNNGKYFGKSILFAEKDTVAPDTRDWASRGIRDVPASGEKLHTGSPICTILVEQQTSEDVLAELICRSERLKEEIYG